MESVDHRRSMLRRFTFNVFCTGLGNLCRATHQEETWRNACAFTRRYKINLIFCYSATGGAWDCKWDTHEIRSNFSILLRLPSLGVWKCNVERGFFQVEPSSLVYTLIHSKWSCLVTSPYSSSLCFLCISVVLVLVNENWSLSLDFPCFPHNNSWTVVLQLKRRPFRTSEINSRNSANQNRWYLTNFEHETDYGKCLN